MTEGYIKLDWYDDPNEECRFDVVATSSIGGEALLRKHTCEKLFGVVPTSESSYLVRVSSARPVPPLHK
jgi:hypothetical protein